MDKIERYRAHAARALLDAATCNSQDARVLQKLAQAWLDLAELESEELGAQPRRSDQAAALLAHPRAGHPR
jgi:Flp pilus assembly protein TadD